MSKRRRAALRLTALATICGLLIWHAVEWHSAGMYREMMSWVGTSRAYIVVLYNLGLVALLSMVLGLLMHALTELLGYKVGEVGHSDEDA